MILLATLLSGCGTQFDEVEAPVPWTSWRPALVEIHSGKPVKPGACSIVYVVDPTCPTVRRALPAFRPGASDFSLLLVSVGDPQSTKDLLFGLENWTSSVATFAAVGSRSPSHLLQALGFSSSARTIVLGDRNQVRDLRVGLVPPERFDASDLCVNSAPSSFNGSGS